METDNVTIFGPTPIAIGEHRTDGFALAIDDKAEQCSSKINKLIK